MNGDHSSDMNEIFTEAFEIFKDRNKVYGNAFEKHGRIMSEFFSDGITLKTPEDFMRFSMLSATIAKLNRYAPNFKEGGHEDSILDAINFNAMLLMIDRDIKRQEKYKNAAGLDTRTVGEKR